MSKKKIIITAVVGAAVIGAGIAGWILLRKGDSVKKEDVVYVEPVTVLMGMGSGMGVPGRFGGVVESQDTMDIQQNAEKKVDEILVEVGQDVEVGTPLFIYDTTTMESELSQAELDLERIENGITDLHAQIKQLEKDKKDATEEEKLSYTTQIQTAQTDIKKSEYEKKSQSIKIEQLKHNIENSTVTSEIAGAVKVINNNTADMNMNGESQAFMTIVATGNFRIKGKVNEQNMSAIVEGAPAIIKSRIDEEKIWKGTFGKIDMENTTNNNSNMMSYGMQDGAQEVSSSYAFYIDLETSEGLMMGQHVYIEMNEGQEEEKLGVWIDEGFLCDIESDPYVWADNGKGRIEKRKVILGQYDETLYQYEIADGLEMEDAIAFPQESIKEGAATVVNDGSNMNMPLDEGSAEVEKIEGGEAIQENTGIEGADGV